MSHARVEELSDSDPEEIAPSDDDFADNVIIEPVAPRQANPPKATPAPAPAPAQPMMNQMPMNQVPEPTREIPKHFQCLYPIYFDKTRSRTDGRKVGSELAVENPLARDIVDAVQMLGLQAGLEPEKLHPKDWANPGRVRVLLKNEDGKSMNSKIKNSMWLNGLLRSDSHRALIVFEPSRLTTCLSRTPPLHPRRPIPPSSPDRREISLPTSNSRSPHAGEAPRGASSPARLEDRQDSSHPLARLQWRRCQRQPVQGSHGGDAKHARDAWHAPDAPDPRNAWDGYAWYARCGWRGLGSRH